MSFGADALLRSAPAIMAPIPVSLKHGTKKHALELDDAEVAAQDGRWLKQRVQEVTSVPAEKVKILVKGGQLKVRQLGPPASSLRGHGSAAALA